MAVNVFLSRPTPHRQVQDRFLDRIKKHLRDRGLEPRTIGDTDYGAQPMQDIRSVMLDCNGFIGIAFRRLLIVHGEDRPDADSVSGIPRFSRGPVENRWLTTPYLHIEAAAAYQIGLPIVFVIEDGVIDEGVLESGLLMMYPQRFDLSDPDLETNFFDGPKWQQTVNKWEGQVREVAHNRTQPPRLYQR